MKQTHPPAISAWMLKHLTFGGANEALAGDLEEELQQGRSFTWYRRQVLAALVFACIRQIRAKSKAVLFVGLWSILVSGFQVYIGRSPEMRACYDRLVQLDWPASAITTLAFDLGSIILPLWMGLLLYLCFFSTAPWKSGFKTIWRGLLISLPVLLAATVIVANVSRQPDDIRHLSILHLILDPHRIIFHLPNFLTLLLSIWTALPRAKSKTLRTAA